MAGAITMQGLIDASLDSDTLGEFANEDKLVTSRLGSEYPSAAMASRLLVENGLLGARPFSTYAKMTAPDVDPPLVDGDYAIVTNDTSSNKNGFYQKNAGVWTYLRWNPATQLKELSGVVFNNGTNNGTEYRINRAIKSLGLFGDYISRFVTLASFTYTNGVLNIILASPATRNEVMSSSTNTKFVARYTGTPTFSGIQTLIIPEINDSKISAEIIVDFDELLQSDSLSANYVAKDRIFDNTKILNLNAKYSELRELKQASMFVSGTDLKNDTINAAVEEVAFFKPLPADKYLVLAGLFYTGNTAVMHIYAADDKDSVGTLWAIGEGVIDSNNNIVFIFDQGYAVVRLGLYFQTNIGAAILGDKATYRTRGINKRFIKTALLESGLITKPKTQMVKTNNYHIPTLKRESAVNLYIKGNIADDDYYVLSTFVWSIVDSKYRLSFQIKKAATRDQSIALALVYYTGSVLFNTLADIKGVTTIKANRVNNAPFEAEVVIDLTDLQYISDYNKTQSPYILNPSGMTYANSGFDVRALRSASATHYISSGGLPSYSTLNSALALQEVKPFAVGGNTFKSRTSSLSTKEDFICTNNPPKVLVSKPKQREFDFYYKQNSVRLDIIDSDDVFYFVNDGFIVKASHPLKQSLPSVASASAADLVVYDRQTQTYHAISDVTELFTATSLNVPKIVFARLTYDNELLIMGENGNVRSIMLTEYSQSALRTINFNGVTGTKYTFGAGVDIVKDWCMTHHKNIMFVSDYDGGVNGVRGTTGGQKCYVSLDNGYTFTKCFDFSGNDWSNIKNASNITSFGAAQAHIHAVTYDPKQNVVWIVTGDGAVSNDNSSLFWSRDLGQTWTHMRCTLADNGARSQMIMALPFDNCVAFGSDASNLNGVGVITYDNDNMVHEIAKNFIEGEDLYAFARSTFCSNKNKVKYMSFGQNTNLRFDPKAKSFVAVSSNGYAWEEVWSNNSENIYGNVYCYDDSDGKLYVSLDGTTAYKNRVVITDMNFM